MVACWGTTVVVGATYISHRARSSGGEVKQILEKMGDWVRRFAGARSSWRVILMPTRPSGTRGGPAPGAKWSPTGRRPLIS